MLKNHLTPQQANARWRPLARKSAISALALGSAVLLGGCKESRFAFPEPATKQGEDVLKLWQFSMYLAIVLGIIVASLMFYSVIRHRRRHEDDMPKQTHGSAVVEMIYTAIPIVMVVVLFLYGWQVQGPTTELVKNPDVRVNVTGYQWNWRFEYPESNVIVDQPAGLSTDTADNYPTIVVPVNERVRFNLVAADVAHSFFVPGFLTKRDLIPGVRNEIEVTPKTIGDYVGHCAEFCGVNHSQMNFRVKVVSSTDFDAWVNSQKGQAAKA